MKSRLVGFLTIVVVSAGCCSILFILLNPKPQHKTIFDILTRLPVLEVPEHAAQMVARASPADRPAVAREVVQAVTALSRSGITPYAVSAICKAAPDVAPHVAATAASLQPQDAVPIAKAAVAAAPAYAENIVFAVCLEAPQAFALVAVAASEEVPNRPQEIYRGVANALPDVGQRLERARSYCGDAPVADVMQKTFELAAAEQDEEMARGMREWINEAYMGKARAAWATAWGLRLLRVDRDAPTPTSTQP
jgi:hypothetical protein